MDIGLASLEGTGPVKNEIYVKGRYQQACQNHHHRGEKWKEAGRERKIYRDHFDKTKTDQQQSHHKRSHSVSFLIAGFDSATRECGAPLQRGAPLLPLTGVGLNKKTFSNAWLAACWRAT